MAIVEVLLNRLGVNSLEISTDTVDVSAGTPLHIKFVNYGAPTHATLKTEGTAYTNFTYENIYVEAESEIRVDILASANPGSFEMQVISGYGMRRQAFTINVLLPELEEEKKPAEPEPVKNPKSKPAKALNHEKISGIVIAVNLVAPILGFIVLLFWILAPQAVNTTVMSVILYIIMLAGIIITWRSVQ